MEHSQRTPRQHCRSCQEEQRHSWQVPQSFTNLADCSARETAQPGALADRTKTRRHVNPTLQARRSEYGDGKRSLDRGSLNLHFTSCCHNLNLLSALSDSALQYIVGMIKFFTRFYVDIDPLVGGCSKCLALRTHRDNVAACPASAISSRLRHAAHDDVRFSNFFEGHIVSRSLELFVLHRHDTGRWAH